ncbi:MAG TPA: hypothetical protein ENF57_02390 [Candidatus Korarchaeota archaeon]|nr:hypothetical protein [Candidatus Korarchaeota archaeon]
MSEGGKVRNTVLEYRKKTGIEPPEELVELVKEINKIKAKITNALKEGPKTIPEIAKEIGMKESLTAWYVLTFVKYGLLEPESQTDEGYYKYKVKG